MLSLGRGRKKKTVGVDLGSGYIKVAVIDHGKEFPQIEQLAMRPIDGEAIVDGDIVEPGLVVELLATLFEDEQIAARDVVVGVGGRDVIIKLIRMDRMDESEGWTEWMSPRLERSFPGKPSSTFRSRWTTSSSTSRSRIRTARASR
jgi:Tfp pilus assembly PilM family ATPase